jgi:lysophospholipase L1-like esterase
MRSLAVSGACVLAVAAAAWSTAPAAADAAPLDLRAPAKLLGATAWQVGDAADPRLVVDVRVRHGALPRRGVAVEHRHRIVHAARIAVAAGGARAALRAELPLTAPRRAFAVRHRVVFRGPRARRALSAATGGRLRLALSVDERVAVRGERRRDRSRDRLARRVPLRMAATAPRAPAPRCERFAQRVPYRARTPVSAICTGHRVAFSIERRPRRGAARLLSASGGRAELAYRPAARFTGRDRVALVARAAGGASTRLAIPLAVAPFELRALGDSVTAGFGFLGSATEMTPAQFPYCIPPDQPNDRCSSNSGNGPSSSATGPGYLPDYGLSNGVAWPAQFAQGAGLTRPGMYENRAVSGSTPAQWASGYLQPQLEAIVADSPNLTVMTLGANPLLDTFLGGPGIACGLIEDETLFQDCIQAFVDGAGLGSNLGAVVAQLLAAPGNTVVVSQYHLSMPSLALAAEYSPRQLELMAGVLNANVRAAVQGLPEYGERAFLIAPPRFDVGLGPGSVACPGGSFPVDGPSRQALVSQVVLAADYPPFCPSLQPWIISSDDGIHPTAAGYAQFAASLRTLVQAQGLIPALPR